MVTMQVVARMSGKLKRRIDDSSVEPLLPRTGESDSDF
jgi:hypothetical protein